MKKISLYIMSAFYIAAGINHFWHPFFYLPIVPHYLPWRFALIYISGICETTLGILLLIQRTRRFAAIGIIFLLIAVFPANIQMFLNYLRGHDPYLWISILRLPLQLLLIWWAYIYIDK